MKDEKADFMVAILIFFFLFIFILLYAEFFWEPSFEHYTRVHVKKCGGTLHIAMNTTLNDTLIYHGEGLFEEACKEGGG